MFALRHCLELDGDRVVWIFDSYIDGSRRRISVNKQPLIRFNMNKSRPTQGIDIDLTVERARRDLCDINVESNCQTLLLKFKAASKY